MAVAVRIARVAVAVHIVGVAVVVCTDHNVVATCLAVVTEISSLRYKNDL